VSNKKHLLFSGDKIMTPITYREAAIMLGVNEAALRSAVGRGIFARLPRTGTKATLSKEQVELFRGKTRLSLHVLNSQEKETWARYAQAVEKQPAQAETGGPDLAALLAGAGLVGAGLAGAGAISYLVTPVKGVPQGNPFQLHLSLLQITR
jgi:hypothetical protein